MTCVIRSPSAVGQTLLATSPAAAWLVIATFALRHAGAHWTNTLAATVAAAARALP